MQSFLLLFLQHLLVSEILLLLLLWRLLLIVKISWSICFDLLLLLQLYLLVLHHDLSGRLLLLLCDYCLTLHWPSLTRYVVIQPNVLSTLYFVNTVILFILHQVWSLIISHIECLNFVLFYCQTMLLLLLNLLSVGGADSLIIVLLALYRHLTRLLHYVLTKPLVLLIKDKRVPVRIRLLLLLLLYPLITLNCWSE